MADGTVLRTGGKNVKDVAGYSLTHLIVGSQGTLAMVTEAILRLRPLPPPRSTLIAFFATLEAAGAAVAGIARAGLSPVTLELMDRFTIGAVDDMQGLGLDREAAAMLMVESDLPGTAAGVEIDAARVVCEAAGATQVVQATDPQEADWLRQGRRAAFHALERLGTARMEDVGVPRARFPRCSSPSRASPRSTTCGSGRSVTPATATSTPRSSSSATTRTPRPSTRPRAATCTRPRSRSVARSPASTASALRGATTSSSSVARMRSGSCARSRTRSTRRDPQPGPRSRLTRRRCASVRTLPFAP